MPHLFSGLEPHMDMALSQDLFVPQLKALLMSLGLDSTCYLGHRFRCGAATAMAGYSNNEIQQLGHWCSNTYLLYIDLPEDRILHLSSQLHWAEAQPHAQPFKPLALLHSYYGLSSAFWLCERGVAVQAG